MACSGDNLFPLKVSFCFSTVITSSHFVNFDYNFFFKYVYASLLSFRVVSIRVSFNAFCWVSMWLFYCIMNRVYISSCESFNFSLFSSLLMVIFLFKPFVLLFNVERFVFPCFSKVFDYYSNTWLEWRCFSFWFIVEEDCANTRHYYRYGEALFFFLVIAYRFSFFLLVFS